MRLFIIGFLLLVSRPLYSKSNTVSFLAFGDSGYHYDYLKTSVIENPLTLDEFKQDKLASWLEKTFPLNEFILPPIYQIPGTQHFIEASGAKPVAKAMTKYCQQATCEFALMLGDNIYPDGATGTEEDTLRFQKIFEEPYANLVNHRRDFKLYAALGNHDWKTSREGTYQQIKYGQRKDTAFTMKSPGYYKFTKKNVDFFVLDTNLLLAGTTVFEGELNPDGSERTLVVADVPEEWELPNKEDLKQLSWLKTELKKSKAKWKIVYGHHTLWSSGGSKFEEARALRKLLMPMLCRYADAYFAGHEHELEVNIDTCQKEQGIKAKPLALVVSGAGAWQRPVHHVFKTYQEVKYPQFKSLWTKGMTWGFTHVEIKDEKMTIRMLSTDNSGDGIAQLQKTVEFKNR